MPVVKSNDTVFIMHIFFWNLCIKMIHITLCCFLFWISVQCIHCCVIVVLSQHGYLYKSWDSVTESVDIQPDNILLTYACKSLHLLSIPRQYIYHYSIYAHIPINIYLSTATDRSSTVYHFLIWVGLFWNKLLNLILTEALWFLNAWTLPRVPIIFNWCPIYP